MSNVAALAQALQTGNPRALEAVGELNAPQLLQLSREAQALGSHDVCTLAASALLALARRGALEPVRSQTCQFHRSSSIGVERDADLSKDGDRKPTQLILVQ